MRLNRFFLLITIILLSGFPALAVPPSAHPGRSTVTVAGAKVSLQNARVRITFDLSKGTYSAFRLPDSTPFIVNAWANTGTTTTLCGCHFRFTHTEFEDRIGSGRRLRLIGKLPAGPTPIMEFALYDNQGFFTVSAGVLNNTKRILRIREFYPLKADLAHGGGVFVGPDPARDHRVLTGEGDQWVPRLLDKVSAKSANVILVTHLKHPAKQSLVMGGLTTFEFMHRVDVETPAGGGLKLGGRTGFDAWIRTWDPAGRRVEPGSEYLPDPAVVDFSEPNPYTALEQYARHVATAMNVHLNAFNTMTPVCLWYLSSTSIGDDTSAGGLREAKLMKDMGLAAYAPPLVRLVPDSPGQPSPQMWWDDEHWRRSGHLVEPAPTLRRWVEQMRAEGAACSLSLQPGLPSADYVAAHPDQMLGNDPRRLPDFTDPGMQAHLREVFRRLKDDGIKGVFFDYCGTLLMGANGGFEDPHATAVSAYRSLFSLVRAEAGPQFLITENPNGRSMTGAEVATGLIDARRSEPDKVTLTPRVIRRGIREWYRNEVTKLIDPDVKNFEPYDGDLLRAQVTAMATMFGKTMLGSSVTRYTPEALHAIGRTLPWPLDGVTARPIGLFAQADGDGPAPNPEVYDYPLADGSHLLMLWNHSGDRTKLISAQLGGDTAFGGVGLPETARYDAWDAWNWEDLGRVHGSGTLTLPVRAGEMKTVILHPVARQPYVLATTRHLQAALGADNVSWDGRRMTLRARFHVIGGDPFRAIVKAPEGAFWTLRDDPASDLPAGSGKLACHTSLMGGYVELTIDSPATRDVTCTLAFTVKTPGGTGRPGAPKMLKGGLNPATGMIDLAWEEAKREDGRAVRYLIYRDTRENFTPSLHNRICETITNAWSDSDIRPGLEYFYQVIAEDPNGHRSAPARFTLKVAPTFSRAALNRIDTATAGSWQGVYGKDGYVMFSVVTKGNRDKYQLPASYMESLSYRGQKGTVLLTTSTADHRALSYSDDTTKTRRLGAIIAFQDLYLQIRAKDAGQHAVALYFVNWEGADRRYTIEVLDEATRVPLTAPCELADFRNGKYVQYLYRGSIIIKISRPETSNSILLSGIFLDSADPRPLAAFKINRPAPERGGTTLFSWPAAPGAVTYRLTVAGDPELKKPVYDESGREVERHVSGLTPGRTYYWKVEATGGEGSAVSEGGVQSWTAEPAASFLGFDDTTLGQWKRQHGKAGYLLLAANPADWSDVRQLPPFIESVNTGGSEYFRWINTGTQNYPTAPEPPTGGDRVSSAICDQWYLTVDIRARDQAEHTVSFYNWLGSLYPADGMNEIIEVLDPESGRVIDQHLDRRMLDMTEGRYFSYRFKGRLLVRLRNESGPYCFLNGIFWEN